MCLVPYWGLDKYYLINPEKSREAGMIMVHILQMRKWRCNNLSKVTQKIIKQ